LGSLAGPGFIPIKRSPLHNKHLQLGAKMVEIGGWIRPYSYTDPLTEVSAVRNNVGIIDVSTLGKLDVRGSDAAQLLDFIYVNKMSNLKIGKVRYGVMCLENGTVLDDGTVARLSSDRYFVTTTTSNIEMIESWFKWWLASNTSLDVAIANITSELAAINIAGPNTRNILQDLTSTDISTDEFPYMTVKESLIENIPCLMMRIGFVGEVGWEIHLPADYSEYLWDKLYDNNLQAFGVEAQRILRLEKAHVIVNQDTDSLTSPLEIGLSQIMRSTKSDYVGKNQIHQQHNRGVRRKMVGFTMHQELPTPKDGSAIVHEGFPVGRVTSARRSPTNKKPFGLAILPYNLCIEGQEVFIVINEELYPGSVSLEPAYDPKGTRLKA
jgi:sarcosine oxidase subunit alpha